MKLHNAPATRPTIGYCMFIFSSIKLKKGLCLNSCTLHFLSDLRPKTFLLGLCRFSQWRISCVRSPLRNSIFFALVVWRSDGKPEICCSLLEDLWWTTVLGSLVLNSITCPYIETVEEEKKEKKRIHGKFDQWDYKPPRTRSLKPHLCCLRGPQYITPPLPLSFPLLSRRCHRHHLLQVLKDQCTMKEYPNKK